MADREQGFQARIAVESQRRGRQAPVETVLVSQGFTHTMIPYSLKIDGNYDVNLVDWSL